MKSINIIKLNNKGYYVEYRYGCNVTRTYCKTKKAAEELKKKLEE